jgi:hypothetical protein
VAEAFCATGSSHPGGVLLERATYTEAELVENRVPVLLFGGTAAERQAWAEETAERLGRAATVVTDARGLGPALAQKDGVVYVADAVALGEAGQQQLVACLLTQEERPKLVVGVPQGPELAFGGGLRPDLHYRLRLSQVNLEAPGLRDTIAKRRARRVLPRAPAPRKAEARSAGRASSGRAKPARRRPAAKTVRKRPKPRRAPAKRSRR